METTRSLIVAAVTFVLVVAAPGAAQGGSRQMGYCFDAAFHEKTSRLFVAGGNKGTHVLDVADGKLKFATTIADGGYHRNLKICGDRVYLADTQRGLVVYDITKTQPVSTWCQQEAHGMGLDVQGNYLYLAVGGEGLQIFDISSGDAPRLIGKCRTNADAWDVWVSGSYAYVADLRKGLTVVDVSQADQPKNVASATWDEKDPSAEIVRGEGRTVCVAAGPLGLVVLDVGNPLAPKVVSRYKSGDEGFGEGLCVKNGFIYLANGNDQNQDENGLIIVDAREPQALKVRGKCTFAGWVEGVCLAGHQAFVTNTQAGVRSIDVRDPDHPRLTDSFGPARREEGDPLLTSAVSPQETRAIEEFRGLKARILAGESYTDTSTPLHAALAQFSSWGPGDAREYFTGLDIFRAPLPPEQPEEGGVWPIFAGSGKVEDTFFLTYSKGQWIWLGNMSNGGDWRAIRSKVEEHARQAIEKRTYSAAPTGQKVSEPPTTDARRAFPPLTFQIWGRVPFSSRLTETPLHQHILLAIRKDPRSIEEIAREVAASSEEVSRALSQLSQYDLVRQTGESRWVTNIPIFVAEEILKAHQIGLKYARIEADLLRDDIPALKTAYEQCQVSRYHPWSKTSLIVVGALCADFCVSDRVRFRREYFDERLLPPRHPDGRRWGYSGEETLASPLPSRKYQFYQNVTSDSGGGITRFGYFQLLDEKRMSPPRGPEGLHGGPEGKIWLSLTTPATPTEIGERTGLSSDTIQATLDKMSRWNPPGVVEENGRYVPSIPILSADDLGRLLPEADRVAEIILKQVTIPMEKEMDEEAKRLGLRFPLPSGTSARDVALQILSEEAVISPVAQPPVPWNFGVWGWNGRLAMWEDVQ
jgi:predicted transcriptional regulator